MRPIQASHGCWTCKKRKIGCDKGLPLCNNCVRTGRQCLGYGLRLIWPDKQDGRRKIPKLPTHTDPERHDVPAYHYGEQFLNLSFDDIQQSNHVLGSLALYSNPKARPKASLAFLPDLRGQEPELLFYYQERIARMITTIDVNNGFRQELLPMAMTGTSLAAKSLLNAILALSAFHRHDSAAAFPYKNQALQLLSQSLKAESLEDGQVEPQIAASMMLCVYNVFDESEGNWHLHLNGTRSLLHRYADMKGSPLEYNFLSTWFLYHEILGAFSQPHKHQYKGTASLERITGSELDKSVIIGSLGCSIEVMEIIHHINQLRSIATRKSSEDLRPDFPQVMWTCQGLQDRLMRLKQQLPADFRERTPKEKTKIQLTAELYRSAAVLYLRAICPNIDATNQTPRWLDLSFELLAGLEICTSPWPLFVVACESVNDQQRIKIMSALDRMDQDRKIGNVYVLRSLIENYWKQQDIQADMDRAKPLRWWELMNFDTAAPWFI